MKKLSTLFNLIVELFSLQDYRPNANSGKCSSNDNLLSGRKNMNGAPASPANMNDISIPLLQSNYINNRDETTKTENNLVATTASVGIASDTNDNVNRINTSFNGAKHSLSKDVKICQTVAKSGMNESKPRGAGWGTPIGLGLRGGGETSIANGASGWGPPPQPNTNVARGWGQPQATNAPTGNGTSAWGNAANSTASISTG